MTAPALLPPDPSVPGRYWIKSRHTSDQEWTWHPDKRAWSASGWRPPGPENAALFGYTLATPRPIPGPAALDALYAAAGWIHSEKEAALRMCSRYVVGTVDYERESTRASAYADAAELLRAALETKEAP